MAPLHTPVEEVEEEEEEEEEEMKHTRKLRKEQLRVRDKGKKRRKK